MPHISLEFLDTNGNQHPYGKLILLAKDLVFAVEGITELNIDKDAVSCSQIQSTSLTPTSRIIAKVSCLLAKKGRDDSTVAKVAKVVAEKINMYFPKFTVEVVVEPLVPMSYSITL